MPYISQFRRGRLDTLIDNLVGEIVFLDGTSDMRDRDGDLNYTVCRLLMGVLELTSSPKYTKFNTMVGVLECSKMELYRRFIGPYEDKAIEKNGDLFPGIPKEEVKASDDKSKMPYTNQNSG